MLLGSSLRPHAHNRFSSPHLLSVCAAWNSASGLFGRSLVRFRATTRGWPRSLARHNHRNHPHNRPEPADRRLEAVAHHTTIKGQVYCAVRWGFLGRITPQLEPPFDILALVPRSHPCRRRGGLRVHHDNSGTHCLLDNTSHLESLTIHKVTLGCHHPAATVLKPIPVIHWSTFSDLRRIGSRLHTSTKPVRLGRLSGIYPCLYLSADLSAGAY